MTTKAKRKSKRDAADEHEDKVSKQQRQIVRPLRSNAALRAEQIRLQVERELAAAPIALERTSSKQDQSPFLRLPAEIRIRIYELTLGGNIVEPHFLRKTNIMPGRVANYTADKAAMDTFRGVVLTCRAFHAETEILLYRTNSFYVRIKGDFPIWLRLLDEKKRAALRSVHINAYVMRVGSTWFRSTESLFPAISRTYSLPGASRLTSIIIYVNKALPGPTKEAIQKYAQSAEWPVTIEYKGSKFDKRIRCGNLRKVRAALLGTK